MTKANVDEKWPVLAENAGMLLEEMSTGHLSLKCPTNWLALFKLFFFKFLNGYIALALCTCIHSPRHDARKVGKLLIPPRLNSI